MIQNIGWVGIRAWQLLEPVSMVLEPVTMERSYGVEHGASVYGVRASVYRWVGGPLHFRVSRVLWIGDLGIGDLWTRVLGLDKLWQTNVPPSAILRCDKKSSAFFWPKMAFSVGETFFLSLRLPFCEFLSVWNWSRTKLHFLLHQKLKTYDRVFKAKGIQE